MKHYNTPCLIFAAIFLISALVCVIIGICTIIHAFRNPEMTTTQVILWMWSYNRNKIAIISLLVSYLGIYFNSK